MTDIDYPSPGESTPFLDELRSITRDKVMSGVDIRASSNSWIYHYCSAETFLAITSNRSLRFSDLSMLNDAEERVWGERIFYDSLNRLRNSRGVPLNFPIVSDQQIQKFDSMWSKVVSEDQPFVCCFSSDGDSLSQWRAYAEDGAGFAIGFSDEQIDDFPAALLKVEYSPEQQIQLMFDALRDIFMETDGLANDSLFYHLMGFLSNRSIALKNPAFRDEKEYRLAHMMQTVDSEYGLKYKGVGGWRGIKKFDTPAVNYQQRKGVLVPYIDISLSDEVADTAIASVTLGPKCKSSEQDIKIMLATLGYKNVPVDRAGSKYR